MSIDQCVVALVLLMYEQPAVRTRRDKQAVAAYATPSRLSHRSSSDSERRKAMATKYIWLFPLIAALAVLAQQTVWYVGQQRLVEDYAGGESILDVRVFGYTPGEAKHFLGGCLWVYMRGSG